MFTAYKKFWTHYADFEGKSTRPEYWWSVLCNVLITLPFSMIAFGSILTAIFNIFSSKFSNYCASLARCWLSLGIHLFICSSCTFDVGSTFKYLSCFSYATMFYRFDYLTLYAD